MLTSANRELVYKDPSSAETYSKNNDIQFNQSKTFIDANGELIRGPVLDIGCGDGRVTAYIASQISTPITGVDVSSDRVTLANHLYGSAQLNFVVGNAIKLTECPEFTSKTFGTVVSFNTLHHIPKSLQRSVFL